MPVSKTLNIPKCNVLSDDKTLTQVNKFNYMATTTTRTTTADVECTNEIKSRTGKARTGKARTGL